MKALRHALILSAGLAAAAVVPAQSTGTSAAGGAMGMSGQPGHGGGSMQMHQSMMSGMQQMQSMRPTGDVDRDFAAMMRIHHQQAVDMAKVQIAQGKSPELKAMAEKIVRDQQKEIAELDRWLAGRR